MEKIRSALVTFGLAMLAVIVLPQTAGNVEATAPYLWVGGGEERRRSPFVTLT